MKQGISKRILALIMAIAIVLSSGVLDSAGWLLASGGETEPTCTQESAPTNAPGEEQGGTTTQQMNLSTDPSGDTTPTGETTEETTEPASQEVTLTVVLQSAYSDGSQAEGVIDTGVLTFGEGVETLTWEVSIPTVEGYSVSVPGLELNEATGKYGGTFSRPEESGMRYITATYSPIVTADEGEAAPSDGTQGETPAEGEQTPAEGTEGETPAEGEETPTEGIDALTTTLVVSSWDMGGVETFDDITYTYTWAEEETEKTVSFHVPDMDGYAYVVDSEDYVSDGAGSYTGTISRPEESNTLYVDVYYRAAESVEPDEILPDTTPVATYTFSVDGTVVDTQKVKDGETVYAPAAPEKNGYKFIGWYMGETAFAAGAASVSATETRAYEARFTQVYYVFFADEQGRVKVTRPLTIGSTIETDDYSIVLDNKNLKITGWSLTPVQPNEAGTAVGNTLAITDHNVILYPITVTAFSITFDTAGGTLMDSVFYYGNETTAAPAADATTRSGYTFVEWQHNGVKYEFGGELTESIILTAVWEASGNTKYTVIHWHENANDDHYSFYESETKIGSTGAQTAAAAKRYEGFTVVTEGEKAWSQQTIAGDGSTIINIYYDRNVYTIYFWPTGGEGSPVYGDTLVCTREEHDHDESGCQWWIIMWSCGQSEHTHSQSNGCYEIIGNSGYLHKITAKYGADIRNQWPLNNGSSRWSLDEDGGAPWQNNIDVMPIGGGNFYVPDDNYSSLREVEYYVTVLPGETAVVTRGGVGYKIHHVDRSFGSTSSEVGDMDRYPIEGFTLNTTHSTETGENYANAEFFYDRITYNIVFMQGGEIDSTVSKLYEESLVGVGYTPEMPADMPEGSTFVGWFDNQFLEGEAYVFEGSMPAQNITLYAKWQEPTHDTQIHFDIILENGSTTIDVPYGEKIEDHLPEDYTSVDQLVKLSSGLTWDGLWLEVMSDGSFKAFFDINAPITKPVRIAPNITSTEKYYVSYDANDGAGTVPTDSKSYYYGAYADVAYAGDLSRTGMVFLGWSRDASATAPSYYPGDEFQVSEDTTLYAVWGDVPTATSLTYDPNGGTGTITTTEEVSNNSKLTVASPSTLGFSRTGYTFVGWNTKDDGSGKTFAAGSGILVDNSRTNILYAMWQINTHNVTYSYEGTVPEGAGELPATVNNVAYGTTVTVADYPTAPAGWEFEGWKYNGTVTASFAMPDSDVTLVGSWKKTECNVTYYVDGVQYGEVETYTIGDSVTVKDEPTRTGYTFSGWTVEGATAENGGFEMPDNNVTISGSFEIKSDLSYTVNYYLVGTTTKVAESKTVSGQSYNEEVSESAVAVSGHTAADPTSATITIADGANVINFYYYKEVTVTPDSQTKVYGQAIDVLTAKVTDPEGNEITSGVSYDLEREAGTDAKTYTITASGDAIQGYYKVSYETNTLTITPAPLTVTTESGSKLYDGSPLTAGGTVSGFVNGETATFTVTGSQTNVGSSPNTYTLTWDGTAEESNYELVSETLGTLEVTRSGALTVSGTDYDGTYDGAAHGEAATTNITNGTTVSYKVGDGEWTTTFPTITDVGEVTVTVKAENPNFNPAEATYTLKVSPKSVTFTGETGTRTYSGSEWELTGIVPSGLVTGHDYKDLTYSAKGTNVDVYNGTFSGTLVIVDADGKDVTANYDPTYVPGTLTITKSGELTLNAAGYEGIYDAAAHGGTVTPSVTEGTTLLYSVDGGENWQAEAPTITNVGSTTVTVRTINANYEDAEATYTLTVTPKPVTVKANDNSKVYGEADPELTATVTGTLNGDPIAYSVERAEGEDVGEYTITASGETAQGNYTVSYEPGIFTITKSGTLTVEGVDYEGTYDAAAHGEAATTNITNGTTISYKVGDGEWTTTFPTITDVGEVTVTVKAENANYNTAEDTYTMKVNPATVTVRAENKTKVYGDADPELTATVTGNLNGDEIDYSLSRETGENVGTYTITPAGESVQGNYNVVYETGELTITKATVTVTAEDKTKVYGDTDPALTATVTGLKNGDAESVITYGLTRDEGEDVGTYTITPTGAAEQGNYDVTYVNGTLEITDHEDTLKITVEANSGEYTYDGNEKVAEGFKTLSFTIEGVTYTVEGLTARTAETDAGTYTVKVEGTAVVKDAAGNDVTGQFTVTAVNGTLKINKRQVTLTSAADSKTYDGTALTNDTVTVTGDGFAAGEGAAYDVTGSQTLIGSSENEFTFTLDTNTKAQNYSIETTFGTLTVTPPEDYEIVDKTHEADGSYRLGDTVTFDITVENIFSEEATVTITEQEGVSLLWNGEKVQSIETTIAAGGTLTVQAEYVIQEKDILAGDFTNVVDVKINAIVDEIPYEGEDDDDDIVDEIVDPKAELTLDKQTISTPASGKYVVGERIVYKITATNTGNLTLHDIVITDTMTGIARGAGVVKTFTVPGTLAPGESYELTYEYTVVEEDLGKTLYNAVTGTAGNSSDEDEDEDNDTETEVTPDEVEDEIGDFRRELQVEKTLLNPQVKDHGLQTTLYYEIVIVNNGNVTEYEVILEDTMVGATWAGSRFRFTDLAGGQLMPGNRVLIPSIAPGASVTILCEYLTHADDESHYITNVASVTSQDIPDPVEDESEGAQMQTLYDLYIVYVADGTWERLAETYYGRYAEGDRYYVESPIIDGYTTYMPVVSSGEDGMPAEEVWIYVVYTKLPEETTEPTTEPTDPTDESTEPTTEPTEPTYDLTEIPEDEVPLGDVDLGDHTCCIMHFLIMLVAMILLACYTSDRKKYQERIFELRRALAAEGIPAEEDKA